MEWIRKFPHDVQRAIAFGAGVLIAFLAHMTILLIIGKG